MSQAQSRAAGACLLAGLVGCALGGDASGWQWLQPHFEVPAVWSNRFGTLRSPLQFEDGRQVKTPAEWALRRREILTAWHGIMGPWPELLEKPRLEILATTRRDNLQQHKVRVETSAGQHQAGYLLVPEGTGRRPAVLVPYYEPETSIGLNQPMRDYGYQLALRGLVTLSIGSPGGDAREPAVGEATCQPLSFLAYVAANAVTALAQRPEVDPERIGIVGHSYGGKWAMFAACLDERIACGAWSDPGIAFDETRANVNYWERWYLGAQPGKPRPPGIPSESNPRTGAYRVLREAGRDLHELQALMAPRPFLVSGGSEDPPERWEVLNHVVAVNRLLGYADRVGMTNRKAHTPDAAANEAVYRFFEHCLRAKPSDP